MSDTSKAPRLRLTERMSGEWSVEGRVGRFAKNDQQLGYSYREFARIRANPDAGYSVYMREQLSSDIGGFDRFVSSTYTLHDCAEHARALAGAVELADGCKWLA